MRKRANWCAGSAGPEAVHALGLVHRNVKPSNLMLARFGADKTHLKVIDFGLVKDLVGPPGSGTEETSTGTVIGTPDYMAPEQAGLWSKLPVERAADIYSLGCTLYALLNGRPPFDDQPAMEKHKRHATVAMPPLKRSDLSLEVISLMNAMVDKNPRLRPTAAEVAQRLAPFSTSANPLHLLLDAAKPSESTVSWSRELTPATNPTPSRPRRWRQLAVVAASLALLLSSALAVYAIVSAIGTAQSIEKEGTVVLVNLPPNAEVLVDGEKVAVSLKDGGKIVEIRVAPGSRTLVFKCAGFKDETREVTLSAGESRPIQVRLEPLANKAGKHAQSALGDGPDAPVSMPGHRGTCNSLHFTPDGLFAVSESGAYACVWDLQKRRLAKEWLLESFGGGFLSVRPIGDVIGVALTNVNVARRSLAFFDWKTQKRIGIPLTCDGDYRAAAFSPDGALLATAESSRGANGNRVRIVDFKTGKVRMEFPSGVTWVNSLAFSPDGQFLITGAGEKTLRLWGLEHERQEKELMGHDDAVNQVAFSRDGKQVMSASFGDGTLRVWNLGAGTELKKIQAAKEARILCATFWGGTRTHGTRQWEHHLVGPGKR